MKVGLYCYLTANILTKVLQKCSLPSIWILSKLLNLIGCHGNQKAKFAGGGGEIIFSEAIRGTKLKLCRNIHNFSLYKSYVFYCCCLCTFVAMATWSFYWLIMGKVQVGLFIAISLQVFWQNLLIAHLIWWAYRIGRRTSSSVVVHTL